MDVRVGYPSGLRPKDLGDNLILQLEFITLQKIAFCAYTRVMVKILCNI
jgi:hypothetical protein